eukprot:7812040-Ditylum_brightwellii.AAC.5
MYAALNSLGICAADICYAYLQAPSSCKYYIIFGPEFGIENVGKVALVYNAMCGRNTAGCDFRYQWILCMQHPDFKSCPAD